MRVRRKNCAPDCAWSMGGSPHPVNTACVSCDGLIVTSAKRVHSRAAEGKALPDAVFTFRAGDPQFTYWDAQLKRNEVLPTSTLPLPMSQETYS